MVFLSNKNNSNLVPRVSHLTTPWGGTGGKMRDSGNEVEITDNQFFLASLCYRSVEPIMSRYLDWNEFCTNERRGNTQKQHLQVKQI